MNIKDLKKAIKNDQYIDLKFNPSDKDRLIKLFREFLSKKDYDNSERILIVAFSKNVHELLSLEEDSSISEDDKQWIDFIGQFNKIFKHHFLGLLKENDFNSFKEIIKHAVFWFNIINQTNITNVLDFALDSSDIPKFNLPFVREIPIILLETNKELWFIELLEVASDHIFISKNIYSISDLINPDLLKKIIEIYIKKQNEYIDDQHIENVITFLLDHDKYDLLEKFIFGIVPAIVKSDSYEMIYDTPTEVFFKFSILNYKFFKKLLFKHIKNKNEISHSTWLMTIELIRRNDKQSLRAILTDLKEKLKIVKRKRQNCDQRDKFYYRDLKRNLENTLILLYAIIPEKCPKCLFTNFRLYDMRRKRILHNNLYLFEFIYLYFNEEIDLIYDRLYQLFYKLFSKNTDDKNNLIFYSELIINSFKNFTNMEHVKKYFLYFAKHVNKIAQREQIIKIVNRVLEKARKFDVYYGFFTSDSNELSRIEAKKYFQTITSILLYFIYSEQKSFIPPLEISIYDYGKKYLNNQLLKIHDDKDLETDPMSCELKLELLINLKNAYDVVIQNNNKASIYDTIIINLIGAMLEYYNKLVSKERIIEIKKEKDKILSNLSHSIKNLISTVIDPLTNLKEEQQYKDIVIDNALKGADLIREIVNAMNLSFKGSINDFKYDAEHNKGNDSLSLSTIIIESLKHSVINMFDSKYFSNFMRNYFPNKEIYLKAKNKWNQTTSTEDITKFVKEYMFDFSLDIREAKDLIIGNEKGSAIKFQILFQEAILNAVKYTSFMDIDNRKVNIECKTKQGKIFFKISNTYNKNVVTKTTGLGHIIINNFAKLLETEPEIEVNSMYEITLNFMNIWQSS